MAPSSSAKQVEGRRNTSVWMLAGSTSFSSPWFCQKVEVSVAMGSMITMYFNLAKSAAVFFASGKEVRGLKPCTMKPFTLPWCIRSITCSTSYILSHLGSQS